VAAGHFNRKRSKRTILDNRRKWRILQMRNFVVYVVHLTLLEKLTPWIRVLLEKITVT